MRLTGQPQLRECKIQLRSEPLAVARHTFRGVSAVVRNIECGIAAHIAYFLFRQGKGGNTRGGESLN